MVRLLAPRRVVRVACLGSGSRGNSVVVQAGGTTVLVDAGFSGAEIERRLSALGIDPESIAALIITHEHRDHTSGMGIAARRWGWTVHLTPATARACAPLLRGEESLVHHERDDRFVVGPMEVALVPTCHDACDPVAVRLTCSSTRLSVAVATDIGRATAPVRAALRNCHFLVLEANHDEVQLREASYPWSVKQRIGGSRGHLSNRLAGDLAVELHHPGLGGILLAHLSHECNEAARAREAVVRALRSVRFRGRVEVASQNAPTDWFDVAALADRAGVAGPQLSLWSSAAG